MTILHRYLIAMLIGFLIGSSSMYFYKNNLHSNDQEIYRLMAHGDVLQAQSSSIEAYKRHSLGESFEEFITCSSIYQQEVVEGILSKDFEGYAGSATLKSEAYKYLSDVLKASKVYLPSPSTLNCTP